MDYLSQSINDFVSLFLQNLPFFLKFIGVFWAMQIANHWVFKNKLLVLGILPRHPWGLMGIVFSPFLHNGWAHLVSNSLMMLVLGMFVLSSGLPVFAVVTVIIIVLSGLLTWSFARDGIHVGASGLVMGYWGYLLVECIYRPSISAIGIVAVCLYYFLSMFSNLLPQDRSVSWEGHLFGFMAGIAAVFLQAGVLSLL